MVQTPPQSKTMTLLLPHALNLHVTSEQFALLAAANRDLRMERTTTGELIVSPPTGGKTGKFNWSIAGEFYLWWRNAGEPGEAFDSSTGFELPNGANRSPDLSWVSQSRWETLTLEQREGFIPLCPDFVVELRSKTDSLKTLREKMVEYLENGTQLGWLIDPKNKRVEIYRPGQKVEILENPDMVSGESVLPGFTLNLQRIWG